MTGVIHRIITLYEMHANAMSTLVSSTQKVFEQFAPERQKTPGERMERLDSSVRNIVTDLRDMLTRFWFQTEHVRTKNEQITTEQVRNVADFVNFTQTLTQDVRALVKDLEEAEGDTFEERFDREIKRIEAYVKERLKQFDTALDGTDNTTSNRLKKYFGNVSNHVKKLLRGSMLSDPLNSTAAGSRTQAYRCHV